MSESAGRLCPHGKGEFQYCSQCPDMTATPSPAGPDALAEELVEACIIGLAIAGGLCDHPDEWLREHEKRLRELEKIGRSGRSRPAQGDRDAERYRWLKSEDRKLMPLGTISWRNRSGFPCKLADGDDLDALIDAAMSQQEPQK